MATRRFKLFASAVLLSFLSFVGLANAQQTTSAIVKFNPQTDCKLWGPIDEESQSSKSICKGHGNYKIVISAGDLYESVSVFAELSEDMKIQWASFSAWNRVNNVFDFRLRNGIPFASIHRVFIDNINPNTGSADPKRSGQVLVITKISQNISEPSCIVGAIDARSNKGANEIARHIADTLTSTFICGVSVAEYHGKVGPTAAALSVSFE